MKTDHLRTSYLKVFIFQIFHFKGALLEEKLIRIKFSFQWFIANNISDIYRICHEKYDVIRWYLKGCSSKTIGFQGMVLLEILISTKFPFWRHKIWPVLQVKKLTRINCWRHQSRDLKLWLPQIFESKF